MGILGSNRNQQRSSGGVLGRRQREENEQRIQRFETGRDIGLFDPAGQQAAVQERFSLPSPSSSSPAAAPTRSASDQWVDDRLARDREQASRNPVLRTINRVLEPVSRLVYGAQAKLPGVAAFQQGAGDALGIKTFTPPVIGPTIINTPARIAGNIAGSLTNPSDIGQGLVSAPLRAGQGVAQAAAHKTPALANRYAQRGIEGAVAGGIQGGVNSGVRGETDGDELAKNIGIGAGLGAVGDVALAGLGHGAQVLRKTAQDAAQDVARGRLSQIESIEQIGRHGDMAENATSRLRDIDEQISVLNSRTDRGPSYFDELQALTNERNATSDFIRRNDAGDFAPGSVAPDVELPPAPNLPEADTSLGISRLGQKRKYTNPEDTRQDIATKTDREPLDVGKWADDFYRSNVDNLNRLNDFDKYIEKQTGRKLKADEKSHLLALNTRGADMTSRHILTERMVDSQGKVIGKSLKDITSQIPSNKQTYDNFVDYLIARHAPTRMRRGEAVYPEARQMTPEKAEAKVAEYERTYPEFAKLAKEIDTWNDTIGRAWLVDTGIIPEQVFKSWREDNPFWIPNQRKFTELEKRKRATGARRGYGNQNSPVKKYSETGSQRQIIDPFESLIEYTDRYVKTARRNEVMQSIYRQLQRNPDELDGFATILKREKLDTIKDDVTGLLDELDDEYDKAFLRKSDLDKDNVISALVDGERVYMRVEDPELLDALVNINPIGKNAVIEGARKVTNTMKLLTTGINPIFGLTRNIFRDIPEAYIYSKTTDNPFRYAWDTLESFVSVFADGAGDAVRDSRLLQKVTPQKFRKFLDERARLYKDYKALGGGHSSPAAANRNLLAQSKRDLLPQQRSGARAFGQRAWAAMENLNNALESGPRLGEFKRSRKAGGDSYASRMEGIFQAQDVTTNFKRYGQVVRDADAVLPYLNAAVQGLDKLTRSFKDRPGAVIGKALGVIAAPTIALYAMNYRNPEYQKLSNHIKDNFFLIPTTDGKFVRIPKPRELGVPFGGLLERAMRAWNEDDPEAFRDFADTAATMFAPPGVPVKELAKGDIVGAAIRPIRDTVAGPLIDVAANENFAGAPIVPGYLEGLSPRHQYDANTSEISKKIGDIANVSPKQVDHIIRSYTGVLGQVGLPAATQGATVGDTLTKQVTADPVFSTDASKFFYELKDKLDQQYADAKSTGVAPKGYTPTADAARKYLGQVTQQMSDYTKAIREVDKSTTLSRAEKKEYKRQLTDQRNILARQAYESVRDALKGSAK